MRLKALCITVLTAMALPIAAQDDTAQKDTIDYGPTMGWSSWNTFALNISESNIKDQADSIVS